MSARVLRPGLLTTVQDLGRAGWQRFGVVAGGGADSFAVRVVNRLVGNAGNAAVLEMVLAGPRLRFDREALIAWCGAGFNAALDGLPLPKNRPVRVPEGGTVDFPAAAHGATSWLAIGGGIAMPEVMGSRSTDTAAGMGGLAGRRLAAGDRIPVGAASKGTLFLLKRLSVSGEAPLWSVAPERLGRPAAPGILRAMHGPEWEWFSEAAREGFFQKSWTVTKDSNRMGLKLNGSPLTLTNPREMVSAAVHHGVIQVPPSGQPIILGADRQTIGGYPRIAVVATADHGALAQLRPGDEIRFEEITVTEAHALLLKRERDFAIASERLADLGIEV